MNLEKKRMLIIVPPFASFDRPSLGVHTIQSVAKEQGYDISVCYSNLIFASLIGRLEYETIINMPTFDLIGEKIFGFITHPGISRPDLSNLNIRISKRKKMCSTKADDGFSMKRIKFACYEMLEKTVKTIAAGNFSIVGISTTFEQTNATALIAKSIRKNFPSMKIVAGGANCEGEMAEAILQLIPELDLVFSGESENDIYRLFEEEINLKKIITCSPNSTLERLPDNDFSEYFSQLAIWMPDFLANERSLIQVPYESSRGCWWGQKHHCTFCGLNGEGIGYRQKSAHLVYDQIRTLYKNTGIKRICVADNIMPHAYFNELLPKLALLEEKLDIFYEQKANIDLRRARQLKNSGIQRIQPGIEALNSNLLKLMRKGTSAKQNIALLRYARCVDIEVAWNLIHEFPGESKSWYKDLEKIIYSLVHLQPPSGLCKLSIDRFSPYFFEHEKHGVGKPHPIEAYKEAFPIGIDLYKLAYHFEADYEAKHDFFDWSEIKESIEFWRNQWNGDTIRPILFIEKDVTGKFFLIDSRRPKNFRFFEITVAQARYALTGTISTDPDLEKWAEDLDLTLKIDRETILLCCANPDLIEHFENTNKIFKKNKIIAINHT